MKEFENNNWELKARQLADAFQPTPDNSVWLNVEVALNQNRNKKGFLFWIYSVVGCLIILGGIYFLYNDLKLDSLTFLHGNKISNVKLNDRPSKHLSREAPLGVNQTTETKISKVLNPGEEKKILSSEKNEKLRHDIKVTHSSEENSELKVEDAAAASYQLIPSSDKAENLIIKDSIKTINEIPFCSFVFKVDPTLHLTQLIVKNHFPDKQSRWMLMAATSYMHQDSYLKNSDSLQSFFKLPSTYFDGSLNLIYTIPKLHNLEFDLGAGYYDLTQKFSNTVFIKDTSTGYTIALSQAKAIVGSEYFKSVFFDFQVGIPLLSFPKLNWNISSGLRTEYLMKYSGSSTVYQPHYIGNSNLDALEAIQPGVTLNRFYLKARLNSSIRYSLSKHFALQSGFSSMYAITDRYVKSSSLHQHDLNLGMNAAVLYRF